jgi:hypothetical protein
MNLGMGSVESFNNRLLNCKNRGHKQTIELSLFGPLGEGYLEFYPYENKTDLTEQCAAIGVGDDIQIYRADRYSISAPVSYFQGNVDGATYANGAIKHYKKVPTGQSQMFIAVNGGHCPSYSELLRKSSAQISVMESALLGNLASKEQISAMNSSQSNVHWVYASKLLKNKLP